MSPEYRSLGPMTVGGLSLGGVVLETRKFSVFVPTASKDLKSLIDASKGNYSS